MSANDELQAHTCEKILQEYGNFANNVAQTKVQDLTEQWKKGELEAGFYYIKGADGLFGIMSDYGLYRVNLEHPDNTISLLAKVPSYEEWNQLHKFLEEFNALEVAKENQQLKELLYKCREKLDELDYGCEVWQGELTGFIEEIDNVIGEKK